MVERNAFELRREDLTAFDVVVDAFAIAPAQAYRHVDLAARLVGLLRETSTPRLFFILGAGSLTTGTDRHLFIEDLRRSPDAQGWIATPENALRQLQFLQGVDNVEWVAVSPSAKFVPGEAAAVVLGRDELLIAPDGSSQVTTGTIAVAILDEIERPIHHRERFTVRDK